MGIYVRAQVDDEVGVEAFKVLKARGLTVSDTMRMLMVWIAKEKTLPAELMVPNATTIAAMEESQTILDSDKKGLTAKDLFAELDARGYEHVPQPLQTPHPDDIFYKCELYKCDLCGETLHITNDD